MKIRRKRESNCPRCTALKASFEDRSVGTTATLPTLRTRTGPTLCVLPLRPAGVRRLAKLRAFTTGLMVFLEGVCDVDVRVDERVN